MRAIEFKNVSFRYEDMPEPVLKNASFSLEYGKLALLYGDSGQGKSTVLSILSGVIPNVTKGTLSGEVRVGGEDVSGQRISDICRRAGVHFHRHELFTFSQHHALTHGRQRRTWHSPAHKNFIYFWLMMPGMRKALGELAIIGQQQ